MPGILDQNITGACTEAQKRINTTWAQFALHSLLRQNPADACRTLDLVRDPEILRAIAQAAEKLSALCKERTE